MNPNLLILGGTAEASALAEAVAEAGLRAVFSYAGRVANPDAQPLPLRVGGFGGIEGLVAYLRGNDFTHLIDATHPFAAQMSLHAITASAAAKVPLIALCRAPWTPVAGDRWTEVGSIDAAVQQLDCEAKRIFLAIGRQDVARFAIAPRHHYLLRMVDAPQVPPPLPDHKIILARGPFDKAADRALLTDHRIDLVISKNSGGSGARAKLDAARALGLPVLMIARPNVPPRHEVFGVEDVLEWIAHPGTPRGV